MDYKHLELILGKPLTSGHKAKISATLKKWWAGKKSQIASLIPTAHAKPKLPKTNQEAKSEGDNLIKEADKLIVAGATAIDLLTGTDAATGTVKAIKKSVDELTNNRAAVIERLKVIDANIKAKEKAKNERENTGFMQNMQTRNERLRKAMEGDFKDLSTNFEDMLKLKDYTILNEISLAEGFKENAEYELISTAKQTDPRYGEFSFTQKQLQEMADNFNEDIVGTDIPVDLNHDPDHVALAWLSKGSMRVGESKKLKGEYSLFAQLDRFTPKGKELVTTGAVRYFSLQIQSKFQKVIDGAKQTFSNVVRSLALTNQPVIKDLAPTFSENNLLLNSNIMELEKFLKLADNFLAEEKVSLAQITTLKTLAEDFEGDDKEKADEKVAEAEEKAEEPKEEEKPEEKPEGEETPEEKAEKELAEKLGDKKKFTLSEVMDVVKTSLKPVSQKLNEVISEQREKVLTENVNSLSLSENSKVGFKADAKTNVLAFVKTLSDVQATEYFKLHKNIIASVDLNEYGLAEAPENKEVGDQVSELAAAKMKENEGMDLSDAIKEVLSENPELAEKAGKGIQY